MMTAEARARAAALMGYLVDRAEKLEGRVRFQKSLYLLQQKGASELRLFDFIYHHYGPYSPQLAGVLEDSVAAQVVSQRAESFADEWQRFEYRAGPKFKDYADLVSQETQALVDRLTDVTRGAHWRTLELAATVDFLHREGMSQQDAMTRALALKPACRPYQSAAEQLLSDLDLV